MDYDDIVQALRDYSEMVEASSQKFNNNFSTGSGYNSEAGFEDVICNFVDASREIERVRNMNKRLCFIYGALGYREWQIADVLRISQPAVSQNLRWLKKFFSK